MNANAQHDATAVARDSAAARDVDHTIDRALSALRDAQPRSGSEMLAGRILAHLEHRSTVLGGPSFRVAKGWGIARGSAREKPNRSLRLTLWTATSAAVLAVTSLIFLHHHTTSTANGTLASAQPSKNAVILSEASHSDAKSKNPDTARRATNPKPSSTTNLAQITNTVSSRPGKHAVILSEAPKGRSRRTPVFTNCPDHHDTGCPTLDAKRQGGVSQTDLDAQALADLHAPSHPAPPLPLTPQEKLFLRMLRYGNATQIAELNPAVRAQRDADETAAFKAFFPDPPPLQQPGDTE